VVAEDTPQNLTRRLKGSGGLRLEVRGEQGPAFDAIRTVPALPAELCTNWLKQARPVRAGLPPRGAIEPILPPQDSAGQGPAPQTPGKHSRDQRNMNQKM
jgi:hypothetical protein